MIGAFSPDSRQLAVVLESVESTEPVRLLDPETMQPTGTRLASPGDEPAVGFDVQFSADGRYLAAALLAVPKQRPADAAPPSYAVVWDLRSPSTPPVRVPTGIVGQGIALSPDGRTLYTSWPLTAHRVATGRRIWRRGGLTSFLALDVNGKGTLLALEDDASERDALLVDAATGDTVVTLRGHRQAVSPDIRFSPDGTLVGSSSRDGQLIVWDTATGRPLERWDTFDPWGVGFSPDNVLVHGGGGDSMLRTWDLSMKDTYLRQTTGSASETYAHADVSPDGQQVAYRWLDDTDRGGSGSSTPPPGRDAPDAPPDARRPWSYGTWRPDGGQYAGALPGVRGAGRRHGPRRRHGRGAREVDERRRGDISSLAYVDEGRSLLVGRLGRPDLRRRRRDPAPRGGPFDIPASCCATPVGRGRTAMVYEGSDDGTSVHWRVIDVSTGEVSSEGDLDLFPLASASSPDGSTVAVAGDTGEIVTIDVSTGDEQRRSTSVGAEARWLN